MRLESKRHNRLSAGRRWRKTTLAMAIAVEASLKGQKVVWGAPTFGQVRIGWAEMMNATQGIYSTSVARMEMTSPTGGVVYFRSMDNPDTARGLTADGIVVDEAGDVKEVAWYEVLRPMLLDTEGWSWLIGTPKGRNWFWRECMAAYDRNDTMFWQVPTLGVKIVDDEDTGNSWIERDPHPLENPDVKFDEINDIFKQIARKSFEQEILAKFLESEGAVFKNLDAVLRLDPGKPEDHEGHYIVIGADWGKQNDFAVFSVGCRDCRSEVEIYRSNNIRYQSLRRRLVNLHKKWKSSLVVPELNAIGEPIFEELETDKANLPLMAFWTSQGSKIKIIENLALVCEQASWQLLKHRQGRVEMEAYERHVSPKTGKSSFSAPAGQHDDIVMARALMLHGANPATEIQVQENPFYG